LITFSWFSAGVSSAVATKLVIDQIDHIFYIHIDDQHPDSLRFVADCEQWFGKKIVILQSELKTVANACKMGGKGFINSPYGANCTRQLKRNVRENWEMSQTQSLQYIWGMDIAEKKRADRLIEILPDQKHIFPLIDRKISKEHAHEIMMASGIKRPAMYDLGYNNNNCIGCVKGGMAYWNKIRVDFPEVFSARAKLEREIGGSCINGVYLDKLDPKRGRNKPPLVGDCGILCELMRL